MKAYSFVRRAAIAAAGALVVACTMATKNDTGAGGDGGTSSGGSGSGSSGGGGQCRTGTNVNHPECSGPDNSSAPWIVCNPSTATAPALNGGTWPGDGTYVLTDCTDYGGSQTGPFLAYQWLFTVSGNTWTGTYSDCLGNDPNTSSTDMWSFTANVQASFIALNRTCGSGFVSGSPYSASGNAFSVNYGGTGTTDDVRLTFTKQ
jgi:hypothetical protein